MQTNQSTQSIWLLGGALNHLDCSQEATFMTMVLDSVVGLTPGLQLGTRHSRAVTARAAGADGKEVPTRVFFNFGGYVG